MNLVPAKSSHYTLRRISCVVIQYTPQRFVHYVTPFNRRLYCTCVGVLGRYIIHEASKVFLARLNLVDCVTRCIEQSLLLLAYLLNALKVCC